MPLREMHSGSQRRQEGEKTQNGSEMPNRIFDHEEAKRLYEDGMTVADIAKKMGVTTTPVRRAVEPERTVYYPQVSFIASKELKEKLAKEAEKRGLSYMGQAVREILDEYFKLNGKQRAKGWHRHADGTAGSDGESPDHPE